MLPCELVGCRTSRVGCAWCDECVSDAVGWSRVDYGRNKSGGNRKSKIIVEGSVGRSIKRVRRAKLVITVKMDGYV